MLLLAACAAAGIGLAFGIGALLPREHVVARASDFAAPPEQVLALIRDIDGYPKWRQEVRAIRRLPDGGGRSRWVEIGAHGAVTYEMDAATGPSEVTTRIADPKLPFGGTWTYVVMQAEWGCRLTITEHGWVSNPLFRFLSRFVFGQTVTLDRYLAALRTRLGAAAR